jgi:hypothetical protein
METVIEKRRIVGIIFLVSCLGVSLIGLPNLAWIFWSVSMTLFTLNLVE